MQAAHRALSPSPSRNQAHSAPEQWPIEKKTSTPKINPNESVLLLYIDIE